MRTLLVMIMLAIAFPVKAHEMTPTYFEFRPAFMDGVCVTTMRLFNRREDIRYYEISVYDSEWNTIPFAAESRIIELDYLSRDFFDVYIRESDLDRVEYICTRSRLTRGSIEDTGISSRICSRMGPRVEHDE